MDTEKAQNVIFFEKGLFMLAMVEERQKCLLFVFFRYHAMFLSSLKQASCSPSIFLMLSVQKNLFLSLKGTPSGIFGTV